MGSDKRAASRTFSCQVLLPRAEPSRHFTDANHYGVLEDVTFQIIDRVFGVSTHKEGFW